MIPNNLSYCELDPVTVDKWGIPVLRFHFKWSDYEWKQARHMERTFVDLIESMGGQVLGRRSPRQDGKGISVPGTIIHELGDGSDGERPPEFRPEPVLPGSRGPQPLRGRCRLRS